MHFPKLTCLALTVATLATPSFAKDTYEMVITNELSTTHWTAIQMVEFAETLNEASDGRIDAKVFSSSTLYGDQDAIAALGTGAVHMVWPVSVRLESIAPEIGVLTLPFVLNDEMMAKPGAASAVGDYLSGYLDHAGIEVMGVTRTADLIFLTKDGPVAGIDDLENSKLRATGGRVMLELLDKFGASAVSMPATEMGPAMSQGAIDGILTSSGGWEMVGNSTAPYGSLVPGLNLLVYAILVDGAWMNGLPEDLQTIVRDTTREYVDANWELAKALDGETLQKVIGDGGQYSVVDDQSRSYFVEAAETVKQGWSERYPEAWAEFQTVLEPYK